MQKRFPDAIGTNYRLNIRQLVTHRLLKGCVGGGGGVKATKTSLCHIKPLNRAKSFKGLSCGFCGLTKLGNLFISFPYLSNGRDTEICSLIPLDYSY